MTPDLNSEPYLSLIGDLIKAASIDGDSFKQELIVQLLQNSLKLGFEGHDTGQLKLITRAMKEMRYSYRIFNKYKGTKRVSVFGSARTLENHPDYIAAKDFSTYMVENGWVCITGGASGIMKAGLEGHREESGFGLSIKLPFEEKVNPRIEGDPKHITFRYFFTRKLMFLTHSEAVAAFPGGFGTMDELFEVLTLLQTGKAYIIPVVLVQSPKSTFWQNWDLFIKSLFLESGWISSEDRHLYYIAKSPEDAVEHILQFYRRFHSYRYVMDKIVIRLKEPLDQNQMDYLNDKYKELVESGSIMTCKPYPEEDNYLDLFRISFHHTRKKYGLFRQLIDDINQFS